MVRHFHAALFLAVAFAVMPAPASAMTINHAECAQQSDNVLRYDCAVETDTYGLAHIEFCEDVSGSGCTPNRDSEFDNGVRRNSDCVGPSPCYKYSLTVWNLKADTDYEWQANAWNSASNDTGGRQYFTTNSLPAPGLSAIQFDITLDPAPAQHGTDFYVENVAFNFGCREIPDPDNPAPTPNLEYMLIVDLEGNIVWYQDARNIAGVASEDTLVSGLSIGHPTPGAAGRSTPTVLAILDHRRVVEYSLDGRVLLNLFKDAGDLTDSDLDERYVHHDVFRQPSGTAYSQDTIHVVTAKVITHDADGDPFLDPFDPDGDPYPYIDDGIMVFDATSGDLLDDWQVSEVLTPFGSCTPGYWSNVGPNLDGCDWAHLNSVSVNEVGDWLLSLRALNRVINVLPPDPTDPTNPTTRFLEWQMYGENADTFSNDAGDGDWTLKEPIVTALLPNSFVGQHHATWTGPSTISLFDNQAGPSTFGMARGIELDLDFTDLDKTDPDPSSHIPGTIEIVSAFDMGMGCLSVGSSYGLPNLADLPYAAREHKVTTCGERSTFMEFAASGSSPVWTMEVSCDQINGRPNSGLSQIYRGQPMAFDH